MKLYTGSMHAESAAATTHDVMGQHTDQLDEASQAASPTKGIDQSRDGGPLSVRGLTRRSAVNRAVQHCATPILELRREYAKGFAGSPAFIAPEVIKGEPAKGFASDWYSLGVILFRLACGRLPYDANSTDEVLMKGRDGRIAWERLPRTSDPHLLDLIVGLLAQDPTQRYGASGGARRIMRHPYFKGVDWERLYARKSPLAKRSACILTSRPETFSDRRSAISIIGYARGLVMNMALGPRPAEIGGWIGMLPEEDPAALRAELDDETGGEESEDSEAEDPDTDSNEDHGDVRDSAAG